MAGLKAEPESPIFLHLFSNAGAQSASTLLQSQQLSPAKLQPSSMPIRGLLLDSAPSNGTYSSFYQALSFQIEQVPLWIQPFTIALAHGLVACLLLLSLVTGRPHALKKSYQDLNDPQLISRNVPRAYLFSRADRLVRSTDVQNHAAEAVRLGYKVKTERFEGTAHCRHARGDGEARYWDVVRGVMEDGIRASSPAPANPTLKQS